MKKIVITERVHDFHACVENEPGKWGCGKSIEEAIGDLMRAWFSEYIDYSAIY